MTAIQPILKNVRAQLNELYGKRLSRIILYGSYARGDATEQSDIDLLIVLKKMTRPGAEIDRMGALITDINLDQDVLISIYPILESDYQSLNSPLLINVRREGVVV